MRDKLFYIFTGLVVAVLVVGWMIANPFFADFRRASPSPTAASAAMAPSVPGAPPSLAPTALPSPFPTLPPAADLWAHSQSCMCLTAYTEPEAGSAVLLQAIHSAQKSIRLKMYLFTSPEVQSALVDAARRGLQVRILMEINPFGGGDTNVQVFNAVKNSGIQWRWTSFDFRFTHEKSLVIDDRTAFIMSNNITASSFNANREYAIIDTRPADVAEIILVYEADWQKTTPDLSNALLVWSPVNARARWLDLIDAAKSTLDLEQEEWLAPEIIQHVVDSAHRGVRVRAIFSPRDPLDKDADEPNRELVRQAGGQVRYMGDPYVHAKMFLVDTQRAFVGSENVSDNSLNNNRELGIIFDQPDTVAVVRAAFEKDWNTVATVDPFPVSAVPIPPSGVVPWQDARSFYNREVTIGGQVVKTYNSGRVIFLQFSDTPETDMKVVIFPSDWGKFPELPDKLFAGKTIRVKGMVKKFQDAPEIVVNDPAAIQVVGP